MARKTKTNEDDLRVKLVAALTAIVFGLQKLLSEKSPFDNLGTEIGLLSFANTFIEILLPIFGIYFLLLALDKTYFKSKYNLSKLKSYIYDVGVYLTVFVGGLIFSLILGLRLVLDLSVHSLALICILIGFILSGIFIWVDSEKLRDSMSKEFLSRFRRQSR